MVTAVVLMLLASCLLASEVRAADDEAAWLFKPDHVTQIDLDLPTASREALAENPDEYVRGTFSLKRGRRHEVRAVGRRREAEGPRLVPHPRRERRVQAQVQRVRQGPGLPRPEEADAEQHGPGPDHAPRAPGLRGVPRGGVARVAHGLLVPSRQRRRLRGVPQHRDTRRRRPAALVPPRPSTCTRASSGSTSCPAARRSTRSTRATRRT